MNNDFAKDSNCIALYRFESGLLTADSKGGNTLTASASPPTLDTTNFQEGSGAAKFLSASNQFYYIPDASLPATFPLKSGTNNKTISACARVRFISLPPATVSYHIIAKYETAAGNYRSLRMSLRSDGSQNVSAAMNIATLDGTSSQLILHGSILSLNTFYHITWEFRDADKFYAIYVRDAAGNIVGSDLTGTSTNNISLYSQSDFMIGTFGSLASFELPTHDGQCDEVLIFDDIVTPEESTAIAKQQYTGSLASIILSAP